ncbi:hypothetical protein AURDEDRAFT_77153, partial [Auricularia subglabra TFB-10046 SS5]
PGRYAIGNRWVFVRKRDENTDIVKYKAQLVAQGFSQHLGFNYSHTFALVIQFEAL